MDTVGADLPSVGADVPSVTTFISATASSLSDPASVFPPTTLVEASNLNLEYVFADHQSAFQSYLDDSLFLEFGECDHDFLVCTKRRTVVD